MTRLTLTVTLAALLNALPACRSPRPAAAPSAPAAQPALGPELATEPQDQPWHPDARPVIDRRHHARGLPTGQYDGEFATSTDGRWLAFASRRGQHADLLSADERRQIKDDPAALDDIYVQRSDGQVTRRLTRDAGRNLEPAFSPDGKQIVFTHRSREGSELFTVDVGGDDLRQVTRLDAEVGRAVFHPGGDYLAFVSRSAVNQPGVVMVIDRLGRQDAVVVAKELGGDVRVGFEAAGDVIWWTTLNEAGLPVRRRARWNDRLARQRLRQRPLAPAAGASARAWTSYLADPYFEGRATGSPREPEYLDSVAEAFRQLGLKPDGERFAQPFSFVTEVVLGERTALELQVGEDVKHLALSGDFLPTSFSAVGDFTPAPVVFAGYGLVADAEAPEAAFDSYGDLDVRDRWVAFFDGLPTGLGGPRRFFLHQHGRLLERVLNAQLRGAAGVMVIDDPATPPAPLRVRTEGRPEDIQIPVVRLARRQAERLFAARGESVDLWARRLSGGDVATLSFARASARAVIDLKFKSALARNVVGVLSVPGARGSVLIGAHVDGPGRGERGGSLDPRADVVHPAANDNATGVAALVRLARELKQAKGLRQNVIFAAWSGTELGALGSRGYARRRRGDLVAALNLSALGADHRAAVTVRGLATSANWAKVLDGLKINGVESLGPDDAGSFADAGVPALTLTAGAFAEDHTSDDVPARVNFTVVDQVIEFTKTLVTRLATSAEPAVFIRSRDHAG